MLTTCDFSVHEQPYLTERAAQEVYELECRVGLEIDHVGVGPGRIIRRPVRGWLARDFAFEAVRDSYRIAARAGLKDDNERR